MVGSKLLYSLCLKMIVQPFGILIPKWLFGLSTRLEFWGSKSNISMPNFLYQKFFQYRNFQGCSGVVVVFYFKSYTYNYSINDQHALIFQDLEHGQSFWDRGSMYPIGKYHDCFGPFYFLFLFQVVVYMSSLMVSHVGKFKVVFAMNSFAILLMTYSTTKVYIC